MKVISVWQPFASLTVHGMKIFETRTWPAPLSLIGERIGIAATKNITADQRAFFTDPAFVYHYGSTGLPALEELPCGMLLGSVIIDSCELVTEEFLEDLSDAEKAFGWFNIGGYAWRQRRPQMLEHPIPIQGKQGIYEWKGFESASRNAVSSAEAGQASQTHQKGQVTPIRGGLHTA